MKFEALVVEVGVGYAVRLTEVSTERTGAILPDLSLPMTLPGARGNALADAVVAQVAAEIPQPVQILAQDVAISRQEAVVGQHRSE